MTITKDDQAHAVAQAAGISLKEARDAIDAVAAVLMAGLVGDGHITLHGLGRFTTQHRGPRRVRNPATGLMMDVPAKTVIKFKPAEHLRERVERI